jgi:signal transduction histidine kinase
MPIRTAQEALTQRPLTFLRSAWPWRSLAYLVSGALFGCLLLGVLAGLVLGGVLLSVVFVGAVLLVAALLAGVPVARFERWRLRLIDSEPAHDPHRKPSDPGVRAWVRTRLREQATWRELGFSVICAGALWWLDAGAVGAAGYTVVLFLSAPFGRDPGVWAYLGPVIGIGLIPVIAFPLTAWAGARAALTRAVLAPRDAELGERLVEVSQSRARLVDAFELERRRIERDLHDGAQQRLVALTMTLGLARLDVPPGSPLAAQLDEAHHQAKQALAELRELIRGVHPQVLTGRGLGAAVADLAGRSPIPVDLDVQVPRLPSQAEFTAYFVICEAMANAVKHSGATRLRIHGRVLAETVLIEVRDDGSGGADPTLGSGLAGLVDRVAVVDGRLLLSSPPGGPTTIRAEIPCSG